eukprot:jgi/Orpsp1_1/1186061/evm.model.c7180000096696.1
MSEVNRLRADAQTTVSELANNAMDLFLSKEDFKNYNEDLQKKLFTLNRDNKNIIKQLSTLTTILNQKLNTNLQNSAVPSTSQEQDDNASVSTRKDEDNDTIMKNAFSFQQVPDPGFFSGNTQDTDLFCQLCEDTFKTFPNAAYSMDIKINFVQSRLRDGARNWYLAKYSERSPTTLEELTNDIRVAFSNIASKKLAKIQITKLKHTYGKINEYIEEFRSLSNCLNMDEEALVIFFYNGLHPKFQEEIEKMEEFPVDLGSIYTKCILYENSLKIKDSGSYCNFITEKLVQNLNLKRQKLKNKILVKGISGTTTQIDQYVCLHFQLKIFKNNKSYFKNFKEKFLITNCIPTELLFEKNKNNSKVYDDFNYNFLIYSFLSEKENSDENEDPNIEDIPPQYRDLFIVFSKKEADKLPPHRLTD